MSGASSRRVLIAYDGSPDARNAIAWAGRLLEPAPALVVHCHAGLSRLLLRPSVEGLSGPLAEAAEEIDSAGAVEAELLAAEGADLAIEAGFDARSRVVKRVGKAWEAIVTAAENERATVMVTGARGRSALASALLGSVSNGLVHHSEVPVLVVPGRAAPKAGGGPVLLCFDGSKGSAHAIERAGALLAPRAAVVVNVWESWQALVPAYVPALDGGGGGMARELDEIAESQSAEVAERGVGLAEEGGFEAQAISIRCHGAVWRRLLRTADAHDAGAVVVGSRGLTGLSAVLGGVSHQLIHHAERPVLLVPPPGPGSL